MRSTTLAMAFLLAACSSPSPYTTDAPPGEPEPDVSIEDAADTGAAEGAVDVGRDVPGDVGFDVPIDRGTDVPSVAETGQPDVPMSTDTGPPDAGPRDTGSGDHCGDPCSNNGECRTWCAGHIGFGSWCCVSGHCVTRDLCGDLM